MKKERIYFILGLAILIILGIGYFIKFNVGDGSNYITTDSLLGILIFHNPFILGLYILIGIVFIFKSGKITNWGK